MPRITELPQASSISGNEFLAIDDGAITQKTRIDDLVADRVVDRGLQAGWYYRKWASGRVECWGTFQLVVRTWEPWGNLFYSSPSDIRFEYPSGLFDSVASPPICFATIYNAAFDAWVGRGNINGSTTHTPNFYLVRPTASAELTTCVLGLYASGYGAV